MPVPVVFMRMAVVNVPFAILKEPPEMVLSVPVPAVNVRLGELLAVPKLNAPLDTVKLAAGSVTAVAEGLSTKVQFAVDVAVVNMFVPVAAVLPNKFVIVPVPARVTVMTPVLAVFVRPFPKMKPAAPPSITREAPYLSPKKTLCALAELFVMLPPSVMPLPYKLNAPAVLLNIKPPNDVSAAMSLVLSVPARPSKNSVSFATGAVPPQFAATDQLKFGLPPPFQVRLAARAELEEKAVTKAARAEAAASRRVGAVFITLGT